MKPLSISLELGWKSYANIRSRVRHPAPLLPRCQKHKARQICVISFIENGPFFFYNAVASGSVGSYSSLGRVQYFDFYKELLVRWLRREA